MQDEGWSLAQTKRELKARRGRDAGFASGQVLGSMCTEPHEVARFAHDLFLETNLGDPAHFPGAAQMETEVLADLLQLLHAPHGAAGRYLSGGTEANLLACYLAREKTGKRQVVVPESGHFSFEKAARLLGMELVYVPTLASGHADARRMAAAAGDKAALMVGIAGTTELGLVDPIEDLAAWCSRNGVLLHVDAAFGGYVLPFFEDASRRPFAFDFRVPGVWSLAIDPHKMGMSTIPGGALLLRDGTDWSRIAVPSPYVSTESQSTLMGTRPGAAVAATWAVHRHLGRDGFASVVETCLDNTTYLAAQLQRIGIESVAPPETNVLAFRCKDAKAMQAALQQRGFRLNHLPRLDALRVVLGPHVKRHTVDRLLAALEELA